MRRWHAITLVATLLLAACGGEEPEVEVDVGGESPATEPADPEATDAEDTDDTDGPAATPTDGAAAGGEVVLVDTAVTDLGTILVDGEGMTLYLFDNDSEDESTCYDDCADTWPPLLGEEPEAAGEADASLLGTTERDDGSVQVTYAGQPLYHFTPDQQPGDVQGQGVGGVWWVVAPDGTPITAEAASTTDY